MESARFSPSGDLLAVWGSDGRLRIWETKDKSGAVKQEFIPSAHLSATCTSLEWAPSGSSGKGVEKRKRKKRLEGDILAMGTADGSLLFYSVAKSQLLAHSAQAHSGPVTGLAWSPQTLMLYSCGQDGFIVEWDAESAKSIGRWKAGKGPLTSICIHKDMLLSCGRGIVLWNIDTKTSQMNFMGQPSSVAQVESIPGTDYFVTMSLREMHLQIWSKSERSSVATMMLTENPKRFCVSTTGDGRVSVAAVTEKGNLCTFQHKLNGPLRKPLSPSGCLKIVDSNNPTETVPIMSCQLSAEADVNSDIKLAYGSWLRLRFESMGMQYIQDNVTIKREFAIKSKAAKGKGKSKAAEETAIAQVPSNAKHLQPGSEADLHVGDSGGKGKKRKKNEVSKDDTGELPMEDRLSNLTIDAPSSAQIPDGRNLSHLLSQGLHSKDAKIMQSVLSRWDQDVIDNTVRSLPVQLIVPFLNELKKTLMEKPTLNHSVVKWLKSILKVHSAFLMSGPSTEDLLGNLMSLLHSREILCPRWCQLKGKLELIKGNIESKDYKSDVPNEALLVYQDESSDEDDDEIIPSESEEVIGSDDLVDDDDDDDDNEDGMSDRDDSSAAASDDDSDANGGSNNRPDKVKLNGVAHGSDESMDED